MMRCRAINAIVLTILAAINALHPAAVRHPRATAGAATRVLSDRRPTASPTCVGVDRRLAIRDAAVAEAPAEEVDALPLPTEERAALSVTERLSRSLTFYSRVLPILARYKLAELDLEQRCASEEECSLEYCRRADPSRGDAAAATRIFHGRGYSQDADIPMETGRGDAAAATRIFHGRGYSMETGGGDAAAATRIFHGR